MFGGILGRLEIPVVADLKRFEEGIAAAEVQAKTGGAGIGAALKGGIGPAMIGVAAGVGLATVAIKSMMEISEKWEESQRGLKQATDAISGSYAGAQREVTNFIATNKRYVGSQSEVVDSYAALLRMGLGTTRAQDDLNLALDLATINHISLADATTKLQQAEMGRGRALLPLGIQMKEYPILAETAVQATKKLEAANHGVAAAQLAYTRAVHDHGPTSRQAQDAAAKLKDANNQLAAAHAYAAERAAASAAVHDILHQKLDGGRKTTSDLKQATNDLGNTWQSFAQTHGPAFLKIFTTAIEILDGVANAIGVVLAKSLELQAAIGNAVGNNPATAPAVIGGRGGGYAARARGGRASGGDVSPYGDYVVGERGPELLRMGSQGGTVIPNGATGGITLIQHIHGNLMTERQTLLWARDGIRRLDRAQT